MNHLQNSQTSTNYTNLSKTPPQNESESQICQYYHQSMSSHEQKSIESSHRSSSSTPQKKVFRKVQRRVVDCVSQIKQKSKKKNQKVNKACSILKQRLLGDVKQRSSLESFYEDDYQFQKKLNKGKKPNKPIFQQKPEANVKNLKKNKVENTNSEDEQVDEQSDNTIQTKYLLHQLEKHLKKRNHNESKQRVYQKLKIIEAETKQLRKRCRQLEQQNRAFRIRFDSQINRKHNYKHSEITSHLKSK